MQIGWQSTLFDFVFQELNQMVGNTSWLFVTRSVWWDFITTSTFNNGNNFFWVNRNSSFTNLEISRCVRIRLSEWGIHWHINIVNTFKRWSFGVDFNNDFIRNRDHFWRGTNSWTRNNGSIFSDSSGFNNSIIQIRSIWFIFGVESIS